MIAEGEYRARRGGFISGITLAVLVPFFVLAFCCLRCHRRNHKKGLENKTLKKLTNSRHSLSEPPATSSVTLVSNKSRPASSSNSSGISSLKKDVDALSSPSTTLQSDKSSPLQNISAHPSPLRSEAQPSPLSTSARASPLSTSARASPGKRYDGVYYTHEPIRGAPPVHFEEKVMDVEINHRNTEV